MTGGSFEVPYLELSRAGSAAAFDISGGSVLLYSLFVGFGGNGVMNMYDGSIDCYWHLAVPYLNSSGSGRLNMYGGNIIFSQFWMGGDQGGYGNNGLINMAGGKLIWRGNHVSDIVNNYVTPGRIIAYNNNGVVNVNLIGGNTEITGTGPHAAQPVPSGENAVSINTTLEWLPGTYADKHNVYFGTTLSDVNEQAMPVSFQQDANSYDPGTLDYNTTYLWRIDEVNTTSHQTWTGNIWSFTTVKNKTYNVPEAWQPVLLRGMNGIAFSMYGVAGSLYTLTDAMQTFEPNGLGNCFDPGPASWVSYDVPLYQYLASIGMPSTCWCDPWRTGPLNQYDRACMAALENAGLFTSVQFGEWGYSFHNIRGGYNRPMTSRQDCYNYLKALYEQQTVDYRDGKGNSVTGHSHYECYAGEWAGTMMSGIEVGENIAFTQSKIALSRGTSKQWHKPWSLQMSPWFGASCTSSGPLRLDTDGIWRGLDAGHSLSLYQRMLKHGWFAGAALVTPENSSAIIFNNNDPAAGLNSWGIEQAKTYAFMKCHDRGVPYMPVAIVMDHYCGYNGYQGKAWGYFDFTEADWEIDNLFTQQIFPNSDHIHHDPFPSNREKSWLVATPYGEMFDWYLSTVQSDLLNTYPVILLIGDITFDDGFKARLLSAVQAGSKLLMHPRHQTALGSYCAALAAAGDVEVLSVNGQAISNTKLAEVNAQYLPVIVTGGPIQYQINRNAKGWVVELVHNSGVWKDGSHAAVVTASDVANVQIQPKMPILGVRKWQINSNGDANDMNLPINSSIPVTVGPGESVYIELVLPLQGDFQPDGGVDQLDIWLLSQQWLNISGISNFDLDGNGIVDFNDYAILTQNWLK